MMVGKPSGRNPHKSSARNLKFSIDSLGEAVELCETQCAVICFTEMLPLRKWSVSWESSNIFWIWMYISIHIIDYIGLCTYTSTCLYILLICMYIHIYIYTLYTVYIYVYIHVRLEYSCMQHPQRMISYKARKSFSPKNCLRDVVCPGLRSPSALCKPPTLPLPHQQFQADALISCPRSYEWVQFLQKGFNHFYRFL